MRVKIARVFATKTKMCPIDDDVYFGPPPLFIPEYDEVHISVTFTWAIQRGLWLKREWERVCKIVKIGGPAFGDPGGDFIPGMYLKKGVVITSRGCPNNCPWCFVPKREGKLRELEVKEGNIIQDNNLLACSKAHLRKVFKMLKKQKQIDFAGGLEALRVTDEIVEELRGLSIRQIWLAYDHPNMGKAVRRAVNKLKRYFRREQIRCYVLIGYGDDTLERAEARLREAWEIGTLPFAMLYVDEEGHSRDGEWKRLQRRFARPAITKAICR